MCINVPLFSIFDIKLITNDGKSDKFMDKPVSHSSKSMITMVTETNSVNVDTILFLNCIYKFLVSSPLLVIPW